MRIVLTILLFISLKSSAQPEKVIVIDTLLGFNAGSEKGTKELSLFEADGAALSYTVNENGQVVMTYGGQETIYILLDTKGGILALNNISATKVDTFKIDKWKVYRNGITDTIKKSSYKYTCYNDSVIKNNYKTKVNVRYIKHKGISDLEKIMLVINDTRITIPVSMNTPLEGTQYTSYKPKRIYEKYIDNTSSDRVYKYYKICSTYDTTVHYYSAELDMGAL